MVISLNKWPGQLKFAGSLGGELLEGSKEEMGEKMNRSDQKESEHCELGA